MKPVLTKDAVAKAKKELALQGKRPTVAPLTVSPQ
jgi:hypothetical protein